MLIKNSLKSILSLISFSLISTFFGFFIPRIIFSNYGLNFNGFFVTVNQIVLLIILIENSLIPVAVVKIINYSSQLNANYTFETLSKKINTTFYILLVVLIPFSFYFASVIGTIFSYGVNLLLILSILFIYLSDFKFFTKYRILFIANQKIYINQIINSIYLIFLSTVKIILLLLKVDFFIVLLITFYSYFLRGLFTYIVYITLYKKKSIFVKENLNFSFGLSFVHKASGYFSSSIPIVLIATFYGLNISSFYSTYLLIFSSVNVILYSIESGLFSMFTKYFNDHNFNNVRFKYFELYESFYIVLFTILYSILILTIKPFLIIYLGDFSTNLNFILFEYLIIINFIVLVKIPYNTLITSLSLFKETLAGPLIELLILISFPFILNLLFGISGLFFGFILSFLFRTIYTLLFIKQKIKDTIVKKSIPKYLFSISFLVFFYLFNQTLNYKVYNFYDWMVLLLISSILTLLLFSPFIYSIIKRFKKL
jgi:hypothetical protein